jgi:hypothetical protein
LQVTATAVVILTSLRKEWQWNQIDFRLTNRRSFQLEWLLLDSRNHLAGARHYPCQKARRTGLKPNGVPGNAVHADKDVGCKDSDGQVEEPAAKDKEKNLPGRQIMPQGLKE